MHTEVKLTNEGISVSLYDGNILVDEAWETWAELSPGEVIPPVDETKYLTVTE